MRGFTIIELLVVIGITTILVMTAIPIYGSFQVSSQLNENSSQIIQTLRTARIRSMAGLNGAFHGVELQNNSYTLFQNSTGTSYDRTIQLGNSLSANWGLSDGSNIIFFSSSSGVPSATGTINLNHQEGGVLSIIINDFGIIEAN